MSNHNAESVLPQSFRHKPKYSSESWGLIEWTDAFFRVAVEGQVSTLQERIIDLAGEWDEARVLTDGSQVVAAKKVLSLLPERTIEPAYYCRWNARRFLPKEVA